MKGANCAIENHAVQLQREELRRNLGFSIEKLKNVLPKRLKSHLASHFYLTFPKITLTTLEFGTGVPLTLDQSNKGLLPTLEGFKRHFVDRIFID